MTLTIPAAPILGHVEGVELVDTGNWAAMSGPFTATPEMIAAAVAALDCPAVRRPVLKAGHGGQHGIGEPALGYVANLRVTNEGQTLIGDYRGMPGWLTEVDADGQSVLASAYPDRSIEGEYGYRCQLGHEHPFVVHAVALLGVERPAIGTLQSLQELYGVVAATTPSPGGVLTYASSRQETHVPAQITAAATTDDVRRAFYATPEGSDWDIWIREMFVDPPELIVDDDAKNTISRIPYTCAPDGTVTFGPAQLVKVEYVAARTSATTPVVSFASRDESRALVQPTATTEPSTTTVAEPDAAGVTTPEEEAPMADTLIDGLRQQLGLAADADEPTVLAANAEALAERAEAGTTSEPVAASLPEGTVLVEAATLDELRRQAAAGAEAREQQLVEHRTRTVDAAIKDGRVAPARREHWLTQLAADPGAETVLTSLEKGLVPLVEAGSSSVEDSDDPYTAIYGAEKVS